MIFLPTGYLTILKQKKPCTTFLTSNPVKKFTFSAGEVRSGLYLFQLAGFSIMLLRICLSYKYHSKINYFKNNFFKTELISKIMKL